MKGIVNPSGYRIPNPQLNPVLEPLFCRKTLDQLLHSSQWALSCFRKLHISEIISDTPRWGVCIYIYIKSVWVCDYMQEIWRNTPGKITWQWKNSNLKMYLLLKMVMFHWHVGFRRGITTCRAFETVIKLAIFITQPAIYGCFSECPIV